MDKTGEILIYTSPEGLTEIDVKLENETLWLTEQQIALLFERDRTVIGRHIKNIIKDDELDEKSTVQKMHIANSDKPVNFYNLDMILSVGYRVNSKRGTQFRIWASSVLKQHLAKGYTLNLKQLEKSEKDIADLKTSIAMLEQIVSGRTENIDQVRDLVKIIADFSSGLTLLDDYDNKRLDNRGLTEKKSVILKYDDFIEVVYKLKSGFESEIFGREKDESFRSSIGQIYQSYDGLDLYPSIENKAAMLLYLVVKNHSFVDGNKRIAASVFLYFLDKNRILYGKNGHPFFDSNTLAALTLMIAESRPEEKDVLIKIIVSILNRSRYNKPA